MKEGCARKYIPNRTTLLVLLMLLVVVGYWWVSYRNVAAIMLKKQGEEAFFHAIQRNDAVAMAALLDKGLGPQSLDAKMKDYGPPLIFAIHHHADRVVRLLLERGANPNCLGYDSTLVIAINNASEMEKVDSEFRIVKMLLEKGAKDTSQRYGENALMAAVWRRRADLVTLLLDNGTDPNATPTPSVTALSMAVDMKDIQMIKLLLSRGADPNHQDQNGRRVVQNKSNDKVIDWLLRQARQKKP